MDLDKIDLDQLAFLDDFFNEESAFCRKMESHFKGRPVQDCDLCGGYGDLTFRTRNGSKCKTGSKCKKCGGTGKV